MASVVHAYLGQACLLEQPLELYKKHFGVERSPIFLTEDKPLILIRLPQEQPFFSLARFMAPERLFEKSPIGGTSSVHWRDDYHTIPHRPVTVQVMKA
jgi:hypothetical protein